MKISNPFGLCRKIGICYDSAQQPFFEALVMENLKLLWQSAAARNLFDAIDAARPARTHGGDQAKFNVVIQPPLGRKLVAPGMTSSGAMRDQGKFDQWKGYDPAGETDRCALIPTMSAKVAAQAVDRTAGEDGTGSAAWVYYSNYEIITKSGTWLPPFITLGHELIHCLHYLTGTCRTGHGGKDEEWATVGIKGFAGETHTENGIRADFADMPQRAKYFADD